RRPPGSRSSSPRGGRRSRRPPAQPAAPRGRPSSRARAAESSCPLFLRGDGAAYGPREHGDVGTLVSFHAHPDDEAIATGGVIAQSAADGHRVVLVLATRGEHG